MRDSQADISKAQTLLGYQPTRLARGRPEAHARLVPIGAGDRRRALGARLSNADRAPRSVFLFLGHAPSVPWAHWPHQSRLSRTSGSMDAARRAGRKEAMATMPAMSATTAA